MGLIDVDSTDYVTISAAGALAGVPEQTVQQWIADGKLPALAGNRGRLVRLEDVQRLLASEDTSPGTFAATAEDGAAAAISQDKTGDKESGHDKIGDKEASATALAARAVERS